MKNLYSLHSNPEVLNGYADAVRKVPSIAWEELTAADLKGMLPMLLGDPWIASLWASTFAERKRVPLAEPVIATDAKAAYNYALYNIVGPWAEGEPAIATSSYYSVAYASEVLNDKRFIAGEPAILTSPEDIFDYVRFVLKRPWTKGAQVLKTQRPDLYKEYEAWCDWNCK